MKTKWIVTYNAGYTELWKCIRMEDSTLFPVAGPFRLNNKLGIDSNESERNKQKAWADRLPLSCLPHR